MEVSHQPRVKTGSGLKLFERTRRAFFPSVQRGAEPLHTPRCDIREMASMIQNSNDRAHHPNGSLKYPGGSGESESPPPRTNRLFAYRIALYVLLSILPACLLFMYGNFSSRHDELACAFDPPQGNFLTPQEIEWLAAHPRINLAPDPDYPPIEFFDERGNYGGIAADYVKIIETTLGIDFNIVRISNWSDILVAARNRTVDMFGAASATPQRSVYMLFTSPFIEFPSVIIVRENVSESLTPKQLEGMKVAVVDGYADHDFLVNHYPELKLIPVPDVSTGLRQVSFGTVDAFVANLASAVYYIEKLGISNLHFGGNTGYSYRMALAVRSDWPELSGILEKALSRIGQRERDIIYRKWIRFDTPSPFRKTSFRACVLTALAIMLVLLPAMVLWNRLLKSLVNSKTEALREEIAKRIRTEEQLRRARDELEKRVRERTTPHTREIEDR